MKGGRGRARDKRDSCINKDMKKKAAGQSLHAKFLMSHHIDPEDEK